MYIIVAFWATALPNEFILCENCGSTIQFQYCGLRLAGSSGAIKCLLKVVV